MMKLSLKVCPRFLRDYVEFKLDLETWNISEVEYKFKFELELENQSKYKGGTKSSSVQTTASRS
jgi:hypothetical protein